MHAGIAIGLHTKMQACMVYSATCIQLFQSYIAVSNVIFHEWVLEDQISSYLLALSSGGLYTNFAHHDRNQGSHNIVSAVA